MAKGSPKLDRIQADLRQQLEAIKADPDFVEFLLGWYGLLQRSGGFDRPARFWDKSQAWTTSKQRKRKRELQKEYGENWKKMWEGQKALVKSYTPPRTGRGFCSIETRIPMEPHRPFHWEFWFAVCDIKRYLTQVSGRPHWALIAGILFPKKSFFYAQAEWTKRHERFLHIDNGRRLDIARRFYERHKSDILKALQTGIPIWPPTDCEEGKNLVPIEILAEMLPKTTVWVSTPNLPFHPYAEEKK